MHLSPSLLKVLGTIVQGDFADLTLYTSKRKGIVFFPKSPPKEPPSYDQIHQRNKFRHAIAVWNATPLDTRANWLLAARRSSLTCSGYNLFLFHQLTKEDAYIRTIERQSGITLL